MRILFPGRFQPWHQGHEALVNQLLDGGNEVIIGVRDTEEGPDNPYSLGSRIAVIKYLYRQDPRVSIQAMPDFDEIAFGRDPGWDFIHVELSSEVKKIRGRDLR